MFGVFNKSKTDKRKKPKELQASCEGVSKKRGAQNKPEKGRAKVSKGSQSNSTGDIRAQALANARAARERLGEDTIQQIAEIISRKENNPFEQAKRKLATADSDRITDEIMFLLDEK